MTLVGSRQSVQLYQAGDLYEGASFGNLLDALDASYCTFDGGDSSEFDATYPDPYGGYQGQEDCGTVTPAYIMSTSYGYTEADLTPAYEQRQCAEYAKLGLMGISVFFSSGDNGVAGNGGVCLDADGQEDYEGTSFAPGFPVDCPYVTAVGATQVNPNATVRLPNYTLRYSTMLTVLSLCRSGSPRVPASKSSTPAVASPTSSRCPLTRHLPSRITCRHTLRATLRAPTTPRARALSLISLPTGEHYFAIPHGVL